MDFKKKMIVDYGIKLNEILGNYRAEYCDIMKKTIEVAENNQATSSDLPQNEPIEINLVQEPIEAKETNNMTHIEYNNDFDNNNDFNDNFHHVSISKCTIEDAVLEDQTNLFDNSINMAASTVNQSFLGGERRKARRMTGKKIIKRKFDDTEDLKVYKKAKTEKMESFLVSLKDTLKFLKDSEQSREIERLKAELIKKDAENIKKEDDATRKAVEEIKRERKDLDMLRAENMAISLKIEQELKELQLFKQTLLNEIRKVDEDKKIKEIGNENAILEKIRLERKEIQEEYLRESKKLEIERSVLIEEKKGLDELKAAEAKRLEALRLGIEKIKNEKEIETKKIADEKILLEKKVLEQSLKLEAERKLIQAEREKIGKTLEEEREKINQTLCEEREKINQTFLDISNRPKHEARPHEINVVLPAGFKSEIERKKTLAISPLVIATPKSVNQLFQAIKKEHEDKIAKTTIFNSECIVNDNLAKDNVFSESHFVKPVLRNFPVFDITKINPHSLYKKSIDIQTNSSDPKKYMPKSLVPFYANEDEFDLEEKKFTPALFTKDPKLNYIVKSQNQEEIRNLFGNKKDIDVETIFSEIENVSNFSPSKSKNRSK